MSDNDSFTSDLSGSSDSTVMPADTNVEPAKSVLDELRTELQNEIENPEIEIGVPSRPNIALRFSPNVSQAQLKHWRNNSGMNSKKGLDSVRFACYVIGETLTGIYINDELVEENGVALNFATDTIQEMSGASDPFEAIRDMVGVDPHIEAMAMTILEEAGYGDEVDAEDPTTRT